MKSSITDCSHLLSMGFVGCPLCLVYTECWYFNQKGHTCVHGLKGAGDRGTEHLNGWRTVMSQVKEMSLKDEEKDKSPESSGFHLSNNTTPQP